MESFEDAKKEIQKINRETIMNNIPSLCREMMNDSSGIQDFLTLNNYVGKTWQQYFDPQIAATTNQKLEKTSSSLLTYSRDIYHQACKDAVNQMCVGEHLQEKYVFAFLFDVLIVCNELIIFLENYHNKSHKNNT